jgi:hypothetical protein
VSIMVKLQPKTNKEQKSEIERQIVYLEQCISFTFNTTCRFTEDRGRGGRGRGTTTIVMQRAKNAEHECTERHGSARVSSYITLERRTDHLSIVPCSFSKPRSCIVDTKKPGTRRHRTH